MKKSILYILVGLIIAWAAGLIGLNFLKSEYFQTYMNWAQSNMLVFIISLVAIKCISVIFPPLPSVVMSFSAIPIIGWFNAYLIDYAGSILGSSISYYIAYKYGTPVLSKILDKNTANNLNKIKIKEGKEIESVIVLRILTGATLVEAVNYGAGLLKIPYNKFVIGFLISHPLLGIPMFYFVNNIIKQENILVTIALAIIGIFGVYLLRGRYFEYEQSK